jgi:hypothetical protein
VEGLSAIVSLAPLDEGELSCTILLLAKYLLIIVLFLMFPLHIIACLLWVSHGSFLERLVVQASSSKGWGHLMVPPL